MSVTFTCPKCGHSEVLTGGTVGAPPPAAVSGPRPAGHAGLGPLCPVHGEAFQPSQSKNPDWAGKLFCPVKGCRERPPL